MSEPRVVLVTGSTDGIGRATARALAAAGMKVILHGRSKPKVDAVLAQLAAELPGAELDAISFDLGSLASVRRGAEQLLERTPALHVLINNAGIIADERVVTADGIELTFQVDHIGPFLLTELLAPKLEASATETASRVINVSSIAHSRGQVQSDPTFATGWTPYAAYAQAKLANVMHALELAAQHDPQKLAAYSLHPGAIGTKLLRQGFGPVQGGSVEQGARTPVRLATAETIAEPSGTYYSEGTATPPATTARDAAARASLWALSAQLAKVG